MFDCLKQPVIYSLSRINSVLPYGCEGYCVRASPMVGLGPLQFVGVVFVEPLEIQTGWLKELEKNFGGYEILPPEGPIGPRGILCTMFIPEESMKYLRPIERGISESRRAKLLSLRENLPQVTFFMRCEPQPYSDWVHTMMTPHDHRRNLEELSRCYVWTAEHVAPTLHRNSTLEWVLCDSGCSLAVRCIYRTEYAGGKLKQEHTALIEYLEKEEEKLGPLHLKDFLKGSYSSVRGGYTVVQFGKEYPIPQADLPEDILEERDVLLARYESACRTIAIDVAPQEISVSQFPQLAEEIKNHQDKIVRYLGLEKAVVYTHWR